MKLVYYPHAPYSRKVLFAAYEKGLELEREICAPFDRAAKDALRKTHPLATVPLLVADDGEVITESSIMVEYFDLASDRAPSLLDRDARRALRIRALDRFSDSHLMGPTVYLAWSTRKPIEAQNTEKIAAQRGVVETALSIADADLARHPFFAGDEVTMADCSPVAAISCQLSDGTLKDLTRWPNVARWYERVTSRPAFERILDECATVPLPPGFK